MTRVVYILWDSCRMYCFPSMGENIGSLLWVHLEAAFICLIPQENLHKSLVRQLQILILWEFQFLSVPWIWPIWENQMQKTKLPNRIPNTPLCHLRDSQSVDCDYGFHLLFHKTIPNLRNCTKGLRRLDILWADFCESPKVFDSHFYEPVF